MEDSEICPMIGGDGPYSYAENSHRQENASVDASKAMLIEAIVENLDIEDVSRTSNSFKIADLGCSIGPNTFVAVKNIIEAIEHKNKIEGHGTCLPEFQVFFNDHVTNDFNALFTNLPPDRCYFAVGVPGAFHGRLFPKASLNFVYSSNALHWLSKAPKELYDLKSPAFNKGRIYYTNAPKEVGEAYSAQFAKDMKSFLGARAQELAPGGLMAFILAGRPDGTMPAQSSFGPYFLPLESSLMDMANEGILSKAKIDSFNLPIYCPSPEELKIIIQRNECFDILRLEALHRKSASLPSMQECRAGFEGIIKKYFGNEILDELFDRYAKNITMRPPISLADDIGNGLFIILKRKH